MVAPGLAVVFTVEGWNSGPVPMFVGLPDGPPCAPGVVLTTTEAGIVTQVAALLHWQCCVHFICTDALLTLA